MTEQNIPDAPAQDPLIADQAPAAPSPDHNFHHRSSRRVKIKERMPHRRPRSLWIGVLLFLIGVEAAAQLAISANISIAEENRNTLNQSIKNGEAERATLTAQIAEMTEQIAKQVYNRLPELRQMVFDKVIPIDSGMAKNIVFVEAGLGERKTTEYRIVVQNLTPAQIRNHLELLLFNQAGVQTGRSVVAGNELGPSPIVLDASEIRSYSDKVRLDEDRNPPFYFMLRAHPAGK